MPYRLIVTALIPGLNNTVLVTWDASHKGWVLPGGRRLQGDADFSKSTLAKALRDNYALDLVVSRLVYVHPWVNDDANDLHVFLTMVNTQGLKDNASYLPIQALTSQNPNQQYGAFFQRMFDTLKNTEYLSSNQDP
jgi:hypothetical protein